MIQDSTSTSYRNLDDIRRRKDELLTDITKDSTTMENLWYGLFHKPDNLVTTPTSRFSGMMKTGVGILDGIILGWKLYRKFGGGKKKSQKKKKSFFSFL